MGEGGKEDLLVRGNVPQETRNSSSVLGPDPESQRGLEAGTESWPCCSIRQGATWPPCRWQARPSLSGQSGYREAGYLKGFLGHPGWTQGTAWP